MKHNNKIEKDYSIPFLLYLLFTVALLGLILLSCNSAKAQDQQYIPFSDNYKMPENYTVDLEAFKAKNPYGDVERYENTVAVKSNDFFLGPQIDYPNIFIYYNNDIKGFETHVYITYDNNIVYRSIYLDTYNFNEDTKVRLHKEQRSKAIGWLKIYNDEQNLLPTLVKDNQTYVYLTYYDYLNKKVNYEFVSIISN